MLQLLSEPGFFIGVAVGLPLGAILLACALLLLPGYDDHVEAQERSSRPLTTPSAREASPATVARHDKAAARRWPRENSIVAARDVDGFAQQRTREYIESLKWDGKSRVEALLRAHPAVGQFALAGSDGPGDQLLRDEIAPPNSRIGSELGTQGLLQPLGMIQEPGQGANDHLYGNALPGNDLAQGLPHLFDLGGSSARHEGSPRQNAESTGAVSEVAP